MAYDSQNTPIQLPFVLWVRIVFHLRRRSTGRRESGAFLLGQKRDGVARVRAFICYDDLDPNAYQSGNIAFHDTGYAALWRHCHERKLKVLADVHTHPGQNVQQSKIDKKNPMIPTVGHTALIVPNFGRTSCWSLNGVGVYEYLGNFNWRTHSSAASTQRIALTLW